MVTTIGRKPPVAFAKPVTTPVPSATRASLTVEATPEVPTERTTSPGSSDEPEGGAHVVAGAGADDRAGRRSRAATAPGATMRGSATSCPSAAAARSGRHSPVAVEK